MRFCAAIHGLSVLFGGRTVLNSVGIDFPAGKITVLMGHSGSGKTTLLRSINRLNECFDGYEGKGDVRIEDAGMMTPVQNFPLPVLRRLVGMVFQTPNPLPQSIRKNMLLPLKLVGGLKEDAAEDAMKRSLEEVGLWREVSDRLDSPALNLSGGQQQRLCLARALVLGPKILLLDEPTASLDRQSASRVEELILSLKERYSVIMVSHSLPQARRLADFLVFLSEGDVEKIMDASEFPKGAEAEKFLDKLL